MSERKEKVNRTVVDCSDPRNDYENVLKLYRDITGKEPPEEELEEFKSLYQK